MKIFAVQTFALFLLIFGLSDGAQAQYVTIPDANFRAFLQQEYPACFNGQGLMNTNCTAIVNETELRPNYEAISNLDGVQYFTNIQYLDCSNNYLVSLPPLPSSIDYLTCTENYLTSLPTLPSGLRSLDCGMNRLTSLPTLPQTLNELYCYENYYLTSLPTLPSNLTDLDCTDCSISNLPTLPTQLDGLYCGSNNLASLPTLPQTLTTLYCPSNYYLAILPALPPTLRGLHCYNTQIANLPVSLPPTLYHLDCGSTLVSSIPALPQTLRYLKFPYTSVSVMPTLPSSLLHLDCSSTDIPALPAVLPPTLQYLYCNSINLTNLPTLPQTLYDLRCNYNNLTSLPALPPNLRYLHCKGNDLTSLPVLSPTLNYLECDGNDLTSLPTLPPNLYELFCGANNLTSLPALPLNLRKLYCYYNLLNVLPSLPQSIRYLYCNNNHLLCIPLLPPQVQYVYIYANPINCIPNVPPSCLSCYNIPQCNPAQICAGNLAYCAGNVFLDWNLDGSMNNGESNFINHVVGGTPGNHASATSMNGYRIALNTNTTSTLSFVNPYPNALNCVPATQTVVSAGPVAVPGTFNFALQPVPGVNDLQVILTSSLARPGFNTYVNIAVTNAGTVASAPLVTFDFPATWTVLSTSPQGTVNGNTITWQGTTLAPFNRHNFLVWFNVPANTQIGTPITLTAAVPSGVDVTPADNTFSLSDYVVGAYDPNDKACNTPYLPLNYDPEQEIVFTVRFQNTGNYAATNVVVLDTLSTLLRANTLRVVNSSHTCYLDYADYSRVISFNFPNIILIDSLHNEPLSHGFVQFAAKPVADLPVGSLIQNSGNIYFDYNAPIHTNTATAEVLDCLLPINNWHLYRRD